ncbi:feruloyl esteras-like protein B precursor [Zopfia rhizophila CBS 207.26]|uniref:Carboxylic ester hydrolase n=1 Tax=Zopfia rhizophila CBS 207.26 TaxID=1314779 RepID=A0A6A6DNP2_9PEZI|nr:feruloyl esteras-like protein B precursor [Zopfia rhizophila CBS 207.26]
MRKTLIALHFTLPHLPLASSSSCTNPAFSSLSLFGSKILSISTSPITNFSQSSLEDTSPNHYPENVVNLSACEVSIQYTHPGQNDTINVIVWLPTNWNSRFMGVGGGGWTTGARTSLAWPASKGYAAVITDGGHTGSNRQNPDDWALASPGNVNWVLLQDFAAIALDDASTIGKAVTKAFYGEDAKYSYWSGCSTGGRQGQMLAQRYPTQYDGILAAAPAFNWESFIPAEFWPQLIMNLQGEYPSPCELDAFTQAAIAACDELDGVKDGIINDPSSCTFDPYMVVGQPYSCRTGSSGTFTSSGAAVAKATWTGPSTVSGKQLWYGLSYDASLSGIANTTCTSNGTCTGTPFTISNDWIRLFIAKDAGFDTRNITREEYDAIFRQSVNQYKSIMGSNDPDLADFKTAGGKMITWHGLADELIYPNGTFNYFDRVRTGDADVANYFRVFGAPGVAHCNGGPGWYPGNVLSSLVDWVENGVTPEVLEAKTVTGQERSANLCAYPKKLVYRGGDSNLAESYECVE